MWSSSIILATLISLVSALPGLEERAACNDNCARGIAGTASNVPPAMTVRRKDCSSFLLTTVSPCAKTTTLTVYTATSTLPTSTLVITRSAAQKRADVCSPLTTIPSDIPGYVQSKCTNSARFVTACACLSIYPSVTTLPTPVVTALVTASVPTTVAPVTTVTRDPPPPCSTFVVQDRGEFSSFKNYYLFSIAYWEYEVRLTPNLAEASKFVLLSDGKLATADDTTNYFVGADAYSNGDMFGEFQLYGSKANLQSFYQKYPVTCSLPAGSITDGVTTGKLSCSSSAYQGFNSFVQCFGSPEQQIGRENSCYKTTLIAIPACAA